VKNLAALQGDAESLCRPYRAYINSTPTQGFGHFESFTLGYTVLRFQRKDR
jgi:hypothetical protein